MAKKKRKATQSELTESAQKIWFAGLGALAAAEEEGGKLFRSLVSRGEAYGTPLADPMAAAGRKVKGTVSQARKRAGETLDSIESTIDESVGLALHRIGVPTRSEIAALTRRVEALTRAVEGKKKPTRKKVAKKKVAKKKAASRATKKTKAG